MSKEKKVEMRDVLRSELAQMIMKEFHMTGIRRTKEGLVVRREDKDLVVRVVQKKELVREADVLEVIPFEDWDSIPMDGEEDAEEEVEENAEDFEEDEEVED